MAQEDYFLKVDGINGESKDSKHKDEINIVSFSFGVTNSGTSAVGGGGGKGRSKIQDLHVTKQTDTASPKLFLACASGQPIKKVVLTVREAGGEQQDYLVYTMEDVIVSSFTNSPRNSGGQGMESITLNFANVVMAYREQQADGTLAGAVKTGWDLKANVAK